MRNIKSLSDKCKPISTRKKELITRDTHPKKFVIFIAIHEYIYNMKTVILFHTAAYTYNTNVEKYLSYQPPSISISVYIYLSETQNNRNMFIRDNRLTKYTHIYKISALHLSLTIYRALISQPPAYIPDIH